MAQIITNQARVSYQFNEQTASAVSNIASAALTDALTADKNSIESTFRPGDEITYAVSFVNAGSVQANVTVTDDLAAYTLGTETITPLTFIGPALLYINGSYAGAPTTDAGTGNVVFTLASVPAGASVVIVYKALVNDTAPFDVGSQLTNTVTIDSDCINAPVEVTNTIDAEEFADVRITKGMQPAVITDCSSITYTFTVYNYGNTEATGIVLTDQFEPAPSNITVTVDGVTVNPADYTYEGGLLTLPTDTVLPAATVEQDPVTGEFTVTPSSLVITVTGTI